MRTEKFTALKAFSVQTIAEKSSPTIHFFNKLESPSNFFANPHFAFIKATSFGSKTNEYGSHRLGKQARLEAPVGTGIDYSDCIRGESAIPRSRDFELRQTGI